MKLGICTRYCFHEATYAAIRIANLAIEQGHEASILTMTDHPPKVDPAWDKKVHNHCRVNFTDWAEWCDGVLWTAVPNMDQLEWVNKQRKRTLVFVLWHELATEDRAALAGANLVLAPSANAALFLRGHWSLRNVAVTPWDSGHPLFKKPRDYVPRHPRILMPLYDGVARRMEMTALDVAARAIHCNPAASLTFMYNSSTLASPGTRRIKEIRRMFPGRVTVLKGVAPTDRPFVFSQHDITFWPTEWESTCMVGLLSVAMGTPVLTFQYPPINEFFRDDVNGVLVETSKSQNAIGLPRATPSYALMDEMLHHLLRDTDSLRALQQSVLTGLYVRQRTFHQSLKKVLS